MNTNDHIDLFNDMDDLEPTDNFITRKQRDKKFSERGPSHQPKATRDFISAQDDSRHNFKFAYKAARFEEWWLLDSLGDFYEHKWISDVLGRVKGGKEASVYLCRSGGAVDAPLVAAKVYRPRSLRNLKNDAQYRVGRIDLDEDGHIIKDDRASRAVQKRTEFGESLRHQSWISYEFQTLEMLYTAGADTPKPYAKGKNAILMDYVGDLGAPAPALNTVTLDRDEAGPLFERVIHNIDLMLTHNCVHGDLSAYNILYWKGGISLIDFPQVVAPERNPMAWVIFLRDVTRVCQYFESQAIKVNTRELAVDLWTSHGHKIGKEIHPRDLDADKAEDRKVWEKQKNSR